MPLLDIWIWKDQQIQHKGVTQFSKSVIWWCFQSHIFTFLNSPFFLTTDDYAIVELLHLDL